MKSAENNQISYSDFKNLIWNFYRCHGRAFSWRHVENPYYIVVSEIMLQQTQTVRVSSKFSAFIRQFPTFDSLASASLREVLTQWQGLGYNRRARYLHEIAQIIIADHKGKLPKNPDLLIKLPGIGRATAASICAFAFNLPTIFIETNIRSVFLHVFFPQKDNVDDSEIFPLIEATIDKKNPREWYYALMDYGVMLKSKFLNPNRASAHYSIQSQFEGSDRQIRGKIIQLLIKHNSLTLMELDKMLQKDKRIETALKGLIRDKLITISKDQIKLM